MTFCGLLDRDFNPRQEQPPSYKFTTPPASKPPPSMSYATFQLVASQWLWEFAPQASKRSSQADSLKTLKKFNYTTTTANITVLTAPSLPVGIRQKLRNTLKVLNSVPTSACDSAVSSQEDYL